MEQPAPAEPGEGLVAALAMAAAGLSPRTVERLALALANHQHPDLAARHQARRAVPGLAAAGQLTRLFDAWSRAGSAWRGEDVARGLRTAAATAGRLREAQRVDVAWTGPASYQVPVRSTATTLIELIGSARQELLVVAFAAYRVPAVVGALDAACQRGVRVDMVLETAEDSLGALRRDAAAAFTSLAGRVQLWVWPARHRPELASGQASMHAKAAVADHRRALVGSANLTGHALDVNMEMGLLVDGGPVPGRIASHFATLMANGVLVEVKPAKEFRS